MNSCKFVGRLVRDPELKTTQSGISMCKFTIAVDRDYKSESGEYEADFINCTAWRQTAEFVDKWFKKGKPISVTGSLQIRKYTAKDGTDRWGTDIQIDKARFVPGPPKNEQPDTYVDEPATSDVALPFDF